MDWALVKIVARDVISGTEIDAAELSEAESFLADHIRMERTDKGGGSVYSAEVNAAYQAMGKLVRNMQGGRIDAAKENARDVLKALEG